VYQTVEIPRLIELACFTSPFHLERLLVDCVRHNDMQIRVDHRNSCVHFGMDLSQSQREDRAEGPTLQSMPSEQIRNQLINMGSVLCKAVKVIEPQKKKVRNLCRLINIILQCLLNIKFSHENLILGKCNIK
jgi:translation initiation factor 3 subunit A